MEVEKLIKTWLFSYSCQQKHLSAVHVLEDEFSKHSSPPPGLHIRLAVCNLHAIVLQRMDCASFHHAIAVTADLYEQFQNVVTYKEFAKVAIGLKTLALFHVLKENRLLAMPRLNLYYPREGLKHPALDKKLAARLSRDQKDFRKFFLSLIASETCRNEYLSKHFNKEFGEDFQATFQKLTQRFITKIEEKLPETEVEQLLKGGPSGHLAEQLSRLRHPHVELFLDMLFGGEHIGERGEEEKVLSQDAILDFLKCLDKIQSGGMSQRVYSRRLLQLDTQDESEGNSQVPNLSVHPSKPSSSSIQQKPSSKPSSSIQQKPSSKPSSSIQQKPSSKPSSSIQHNSTANLSSQQSASTSHQPSPQTVPSKSITSQLAAFNYFSGSSTDITSHSKPTRKGQAITVAEQKEEDSHCSSSSMRKQRTDTEYANNTMGNIGLELEDRIDSSTNIKRRIRSIETTAVPRDSEVQSPARKKLKLDCKNTPKQNQSSIKHYLLTAEKSDNCQSRTINYTPSTTELNCKSHKNNRSTISEPNPQYPESQGFSVVEDNEVTIATKTGGRVYKMKKSAPQPTEQLLQISEDNDVIVMESPERECSPILISSSGSGGSHPSQNKQSSEESTSLLAGPKRLSDVSVEIPSVQSNHQPTTILPCQEKDQKFTERKRNEEQVAIVSSSSGENTDYYDPSPKQPAHLSPSSHPDQIVLASDSEEELSESDIFSVDSYMTAELPCLEQHLTSTRICVVKLRRNKELDAQVMSLQYTGGKIAQSLPEFSISNRTAGDLILQ